MSVGEIVRLPVVMLQAGEHVANSPEHADNHCLRRRDCLGNCIIATGQRPSASVTYRTVWKGCPDPSMGGVTYAFPWPKRCMDERLIGMVYVTFGVNNSEWPVYFAYSTLAHCLT